MELELSVLGFYKDGKFYQSEKINGKFIFKTNDKDLYEYAKKFAVGIPTEPVKEEEPKELSRKEIMEMLKKEGIKFKPTLKTEELRKLLEAKK